MTNIEQYGYRAFRFERYGKDHLLPATIYGGSQIYTTNPEQIYQAKCSFQERPNLWEAHFLADCIDGVDTNHADKAPSKNCMCGFHIINNLNSSQLLLFTGTTAYSIVPYRYLGVIGFVSFGGKTIFHRTGCRAEYMRILGFAVPDDWDYPQAVYRRMAEFDLPVYTSSELPPLTK